MSKSLRVLSVLVVFALMGSIVFAYAPVIKEPLPDIWIGDCEDNPGTIDNNLFRFSDAFDLDAYVEDGDSTISELVWSFIEGEATDDIEINAILQLADPGDAGNAAALGKDIRHPSVVDFQPGNTVDFWDQKDSPAPWPRPPDNVPFPSPSAPLNEVVTWYVSDGVFLDSAQNIVQAVDGGCDLASPPTIWTEERCDDYESDTDSWFFIGVPGTDDGSGDGFAAATSTYDGTRLGINTTDATNTFGFWSGPVVGYQAGKLYKFVWTLSTNQVSQDAVPTIRLRLSNLVYANTMAISSSGVAGQNPWAPTATPKEYNQYLLPVSTEDISPNFDVYDFVNPGDSGTVYCEEVCAYTADESALGAWTDETVPPLNTTNWFAVLGPGGYSSPATGTTGGLQMTTTNADSLHYGFWFTSGLSYTVDQFYKSAFTVESTSAKTPQTMVRVSSGDFQAAHRYTVYAAAGPDADGEIYTLYFETHDLASDTTFSLNFEDGDFATDEGGTLTLTDVTLQRQAIPQ
jgi:hypothetical protein